MAGVELHADLPAAPGGMSPGESTVPFVHYAGIRSPCSDTVHLAYSHVRAHPGSRVTMILEHLVSLRGELASGSTIG